MFRTFQSPLILASCLILATPIWVASIRIAHASPLDNDDTIDRETQVITRDLDLSNAADQAVLARRLEHAAREVCGLLDDTVSPLSQEYKDCHANALEDARRQMAVLVARAKSANLLASTAPAPR